VIKMINNTNKLTIERTYLNGTHSHFFNRVVMTHRRVIPHTTCMSLYHI